MHAQINLKIELDYKNSRFEIGNLELKYNINILKSSLYNLYSYTIFKNQEKKHLSHLYARS